MWESAREFATIYQLDIYIIKKEKKKFLKSSYRAE